MRQSVMALLSGFFVLGLLSSTTAQAARQNDRLPFQDTTIREAVTRLRNQIETDQTRAGRIQAFENFRDLLAKHLLSVALPHTEAERAEFASLNELQAAVITVHLKDDATSCSESLNRLKSEARTPGRDEMDKVDLPASTQLIMEIVGRVCR